MEVTHPCLKKRGAGEVYMLKRRWGGEGIVLKHQEVISHKNRGCNFKPPCGASNGGSPLLALDHILFHYTFCFIYYLRCCGSSTKQLLWKNTSSWRCTCYLFPCFYWEKVGLLLSQWFFLFKKKKKKFKANCSRSLPSAFGFQFVLQAIHYPFKRYILRSVSKLNEKYKWLFHLSSNTCLSSRLKIAFLKIAIYLVYRVCHLCCCSLYFMVEKMHFGAAFTEFWEVKLCVLQFYNLTNTLALPFCVQTLPKILLSLFCPKLWLLALVPPCASFPVGHSFKKNPSSL